MTKLNSQLLGNSLRAVYSLSRKNKNETILFWLFLDSNRIIDYKKFISLIPPSRNIGIIMRSKSLKNYYNEAKIILKLCRKKNFTFLVSTSYRIAKSIGADGVHYPDKIRYAKRDTKLFTTCSYHSFSDYKRAKQLNVDLAFISPIFSTKSGKDKRAKGLIKISLLANYLKCQYSVLGGVRKNNIKRLRNRSISSISGLEFICEIIKYRC